MIRAYNRAANELRPIHITPNFLDYAPGSVLFQIGSTKVICAVNLHPGVPPFLKGKKSGWLNAEYAMLPSATHVRKERELVSCKRNGRAVEISRLIGRSLRSVVDLVVLGERTIVVDCDVIQADGGTRAAAITGAFLALRAAVQFWLERGIIAKNPLKEDIAAISLGVTSEGVLLDLDFQEDSGVMADFNFVITRSGALIEIQGSADQKPIKWELVESMYKLAFKGVNDIFNLCEPKESKRTAKQPFNPIIMRSAERI